MQLRSFYILHSVLLLVWFMCSKVCLACLHQPFHDRAQVLSLLVARHHTALSQIPSRCSIQTFSERIWESGKAKVKLVLWPYGRGITAIWLSLRASALPGLTHIAASQKSGEKWFPVHRSLRTSVSKHSVDSDHFPYTLPHYFTWGFLTPAACGDPFRFAALQSRDV